ncbi:MAG: hypothetical protein ACUVQY_08250, partial [Thermoproteota archaeon]
MKRSQSINLVPPTRLNRSQVGTHVLDEREIKLKISRPSNVRLGRVLNIGLEEAPSFDSVAAVDVSTVKIGVSSLGEAYAIRGSTVLKEHRSIRINRTRPMIVFGEISDSQISFELEEQLKNIVSARSSMMLLDGDLNEMISVSRPLGLFEFLKSTGNILISVSK